MHPSQTLKSVRHEVAGSEDIPEGGRLLISIDGLQVGIFRFRGALYAYENVCAHQGGPACQGRIVDGVEENLKPDRRSAGLRFNANDPHVVCPWHGFEYRITTGEHPGVLTVRLKRFVVEEEQETVYVTV